MISISWYVYHICIQHSMCPAPQIFGLALPHLAPWKKTFPALPCRMVILVSITYSRPEIGSILDLLERFLNSKVHFIYHFITEGPWRDNKCFADSERSPHVWSSCAHSQQGRGGGAPRWVRAWPPLCSQFQFFPPASYLFALTWPDYHRMLTLCSKPRFHHWDDKYI